LEWDPLKAMGCDEDRVQNAVRFSLSLFTTEEEIDEAVRRVVATVKRLSN
jgi:cysteine sulfinate desulfinase/cysteine desulfurase-like protein